ncbi:HNH endonuclease [Inquilinus limosus]|uniref:HNH endonuclease signature motif containing protein n=1 Tax=Inquilinus limosus TaxID=171674 RepID=UPI003F16B64C
MDHITPVSFGGTDALDNLRPRHWYGNSLAGALLARMRSPDAQGVSSGPQPRSTLGALGRGGLLSGAFGDGARPMLGDLLTPKKP